MHDTLESTSVLDQSRIGPLLNARIGASPQSWGAEASFSTADAETDAYVFGRVERSRSEAQRIAKQDLRGLYNGIRQGTEPQSVIHALLLWGPLTISQLSGYLSLTIGEAEMRLSALESLKVVRPILPEDRTDIRHTEYEVELEALAE